MARTRENLKFKIIEDNDRGWRAFLTEAELQGWEVADQGTRRRLLNRACQRRYSKTEAGRACEVRYRGSEKCKLARLRNPSSRRRKRTRRVKGSRANLQSEREKAKYYGRTRRGKLHGQFWDAVDDEKIMTREKPDIKLAKELGRTISAVQHRRWLLKKTQ